MSRRIVVRVEQVGEVARLSERLNQMLERDFSAVCIRSSNLKHSWTWGWFRGGIPEQPLPLSANPLLHQGQGLNLSLSR